MNAIQIENISKRYYIDHQRKNGGPSGLKESLVNGVKSIFGSKSSENTVSEKEEFWALKDVSFDVAA